jgi:hypothetical protein
MVVVLSQETRRIQSGPLLQKIEEMHRMVIDPVYGQQACPENREDSPAVAVEADLNEHAMKRINAGFHAPLDIYERRTAVPMTVHQLEQIDATLAVR